MGVSQLTAAANCCIDSDLRLQQSFVLWSLLPSVIQVDAREMKWPGPMRALTRAYRKAKPGDIIELLSTECAIEAVSKAWCERTGNKELRVEQEPDGVYAVAIQVEAKTRRTAPVVPA